MAPAADEMMVSKCDPCKRGDEGGSKCLYKINLVLSHFFKEMDRPLVIFNLPSVLMFKVVI